MSKEKYISDVKKKDIENNALFFLNQCPELARALQFSLLDDNYDGMMDVVNIIERHYLSLKASVESYRLKSVSKKEILQESCDY